MFWYVVATMLASGEIAPARQLQVELAVAAAMTAATAQSELRRAPDGLFYVTGTINGAPVRFLVDTGSTSTVLTRDDAMRAGVMPPADAFAARADTANGPARIAWVMLDDLQVGGIKARDMAAAVAPDGLGVSLLGQNWLSQLASLTISGDRMEFR